MLSELRAYLQTHGRAPIADIALHLQMEPDAVRGMLDKWIRKGQVVKLEDSGGCNSGCNKCDPQALEAYEWRGERGAAWRPLVAAPSVSGAATSTDKN